MNLTAEIKPLKGKYYGTIVEVKDGEKFIAEIKVWTARRCMPLDEPSSEALFYYDYASVEEARADGWPCDSHYQSILDAKIAKAIKEAIEGLT